MSFSQEVKNEIAKCQRTGTDARACLSALLLLSSTLSISSTGMKLVVSVENAAVARTIYTLIKERYGVSMDLSIKRRMNLHKNLVYGIRVLNGTMDILEDVGIYSARGLLEKPLMKVITNDNNARNYLAGAFMASGSVNPPEKTSYHLELNVNSEAHGTFLIDLLQRFSIRAKMIKRRNHYVVYVKAAEKIADFLRVINANDAVMTFENVRISRDFTNSLTRLNNCDVANEVKSQSAAKKQLADIRFLIDRGRFETLDEKLKIVCDIRLENPEASLMELCAIYYEKTGVNVSKSGLKHRFIRIHEEVEKCL